MTYYLRKTLPSDFVPVTVWAIAEGWPGRTKQVPMSEGELAEIVVMPGHASYSLNQSNGEVVGFGQVWIDPAGKVNLVRILVAPAMRGRGIGKKLCKLLLMEARYISADSSVGLRVRRDNIAAVAVYRSLGFVTEEKESNSIVMAMIKSAMPEVEVTFQQTSADQPNSALHI